MTKQQKYIFYIISGFSMLIAFLLTAGLFTKPYISQSPIYSLISPYIANQGDFSVQNVMNYDNASAENAFITGMDLYIRKEYETAKNIFEQALNLETTDPALTSYLYYYINHCIYHISGTGSPEMVDLCLNTAAKYAPLANDEAYLTSLINTISMNKDTINRAVDLTLGYLTKNENIDTKTWASLKNLLGTLEYIKQSYSNSLVHFYDVQVALKHDNLIDTLWEEYKIAGENIANIYYLFEDYENAIGMYTMLKEHEKSKTDPNRYSYYVNLAKAYSEKGDTKMSRQVIAEIEEFVDELPARYVSELQAILNIILAENCLHENNISKAYEYLTSATNIYSKEVNGHSIFLGTDNHIMLMQAKYFIKISDYKTAETFLKGILSNQTTPDYSINKNVYKLLIEVYKYTGQQEELTKAYDELFKVNDVFVNNIQREYLEFSSYYFDSLNLHRINMDFANFNFIVTLFFIFATIVLVIVLIIAIKLSNKNITDQLTGVYNRKKLQMLQRKYKQAGIPKNTGILMLDIDYFKKYNDTYGHIAGDDILKTVANILSVSVRKSDIIIRYGGEEFLIMLNDLSFDIAKRICKRIQAVLEDRCIPHNTSAVSDHITLSMGLCYQKSSDNATLRQMIEAADECLYQSKENGRNRYTAKEL